jgi:integrase/recombinase XerC
VRSQIPEAYSGKGSSDVIAESQNRQCVVRLNIKISGFIAESKKQNRSAYFNLNVGDLREGKLWIIGKGKTQQQSIDLAPRTLAALEEWLTVRKGQANEPIFIALDGRSYGKRLSGRSVARVVDWVATDAGVTKHLSPHRIRHSSITTFLDASGGDVRTAQRLSRHSRLDTLMIYDDNRKGLQGKASGVLADLV